MSRTNRASTRRGPILDAREIRGLAFFAVALLIIIPTGAWLGGGLAHFAGASWRPGLDLGAFQAAPLVTQAHVIAVLTLLVTGWSMLALPKGDRRHKILGWIWVSAMAAMGAASLAVPRNATATAGLLGGGSAMALLGYAIWSVKRGRLRNHGRSMAMLMIALVFIALLALLPGRLLHSVVFAG